jgi:hypothetical protein
LSSPHGASVRCHDRYLHLDAPEARTRRHLQGTESTEAALLLTAVVSKAGFAVLKRRPLSRDPKLDRWSLPLMSGVIDQLLWH